MIGRAIVIRVPISEFWSEEQCKEFVGHVIIESMMRGTDSDRMLDGCAVVVDANPRLSVDAWQKLIEAIER